MTTLVDVTSTTVYDTTLSSTVPTGTYGTAVRLAINGYNPNSEKTILVRFRMPDRPLGAGTIRETNYTMTYASGVNPGTQIWINAYRGVSWMPRWVETTVHWITKAVGRPWLYRGATRERGDYLSSVGVDPITTPGALVTRSATFSWDITSYGLSWGEYGDLFFRLDSRSSNVGDIYWWLSKDSATATAAIRPHVTVTWEDQPPDPITDLKVVGDTDSFVTDATQSYKQFGQKLTWSPSAAEDFYRYRIRYSTSTSINSFVTTAVVYNRASTVYYDKREMGNPGTWYWLIYVEDYNNKSASTNCRQGNIAAAVTLSDPMRQLSVSRATSNILDEVTIYYRPQALAGETDADAMKRAKGLYAWWGDGSTSFSKKRTGVDGAGGYFYATHRYSKATTVFPRGQIEFLNGLRAPQSQSSHASYTGSPWAGGPGTGMVVGKRNPIAAVSPSPALARTASTFNVGDDGAGQTGTRAANEFSILAAEEAPADGVGLRWRTRASATTGTHVALLLRPEGAYYRIVQADEFTSGTVNAFLYRDLNWRIRRGDVVGIWGPATSGVTTGGYRYTVGATISFSSTIYRTIGTRIPRWRLSFAANEPECLVRDAYTNAVHFTSKDSYARSAQRSISRFHWYPNWVGGTFPVTAASVVNTGATTSFYYAWTTATTQFVAVKALDDAVEEGSTVAAIGVRVETEATFRFPDDVRDAVESIADDRSRLFSLDPVVGVDYGALDLGAIGPRVLTIRGYAVTQSSTTNDLIDIQRVSRVFQQRIRCHVVSPTSAATAVQGYVLEPPVVQDSGAPTHKRWTVRVGALR